MLGLKRVRTTFNWGIGAFQSGQPTWIHREEIETGESRRKRKNKFVHKLDR